MPAFNHPQDTKHNVVFSQKGRPLGHLWNTTRDSRADEACDPPAYPTCPSAPASLQAYFFQADLGASPRLLPAPRPLSHDCGPLAQHPLPHTLGHSSGLPHMPSYVPLRQRTSLDNGRWFPPALGAWQLLLSLRGGGRPSGPRRPSTLPRPPDAELSASPGLRWGEAE